MGPVTPHELERAETVGLHPTVIAILKMCTYF
jgi:hypothetical protein